jgi:hypothetical protein
MRDLQKVGGVAALIEAAIFVAAMVVFFTFFASALPSADFPSLEVDPVENVAFLVNNQAIMYAFYLVVYVAWAALLVVLALALYQRLKTGSPAMAQTATAFALIWAGLIIATGMVANTSAGVLADVYGRDPAQAGTIWLALHSVQQGLGGEAEIVGSIWILLVSWAALRTGELTRALNYVGVVVGVAGLITVVPALRGLAGPGFGLGNIVWFAFLGIVMLRSRPNAAA